MASPVGDILDAAETCGFAHLFLPRRTKDTSLHRTRYSTQRDAATNLLPVPDSLLSIPDTVEIVRIRKGASRTLKGTRNGQIQSRRQ